MTLFLEGPSLSDQSIPVRHLNGLADFPPAGEVPCVREADALARLHGLDPAIAAVKKDAGAVRLVDEREAVSRRTQAGEFFHKIPFVHAEMGGDRSDVLVAHLDKPRPPAAIRAALAEEMIHRATINTGRLRMTRTRKSEIDAPVRLGEKIAAKMRLEP